MDDRTNLIFNGDFLNGSDGWSTSSNRTITSSNYNGSGGSLRLTSSGSPILHSYYIPVNAGDTYKIEMDVRKIAITQTNFIYIECYDANFSSIPVNKIEHVCNTTLSQDVNNGDTKVYVNSVSGWYTSATYRYVGICDSPAYEYNRAIYIQKYDSSTVDTTNKCVTMQTAWAGGAWKAGTRCACFTDGGTWVYPFTLTTSDSTDWHHREGAFRVRNGAKYIRFGCICYSNQDWEMTNIKITNTSRLQMRDWLDSSEYSVPIISSSSVTSNMFEEGMTMPVRYIRDYLNGSTSNTGNHWCCLKAYDIYESNKAYACNITYYNSNNSQISVGISGASPDNTSNSLLDKSHYITRESVSLIPYSNGPDGLAYLRCDLGAVYDLSRIVIWHYYDGRTYHNTKTQVSTDGVNWITVFDSAVEGEYVETSSGHTIYLNNNTLKLYESGEIKSNQFIEY